MINTLRAQTMSIAALLSCLMAAAVWAQGAQTQVKPTVTEQKKAAPQQQQLSTPAASIKKETISTPTLSGVEPTKDGYALLGRGFGTESAKVEVFQGSLRLDMSAVASVSDDRITLRIGESARPRGAVEYKVSIAGQMSNSVSYTQAIPAPTLSDVEHTDDGYVLVGRGFGTEASLVQVFQGSLRLDIPAVASVSNNRITMRLGESVRPRGAVEHKVSVAGQMSNVVLHTHPIPPPVSVFGCATGFTMQVDKVGEADRCYQKIAVSCGVSSGLFDTVAGRSGTAIPVEVDNPPPPPQGFPPGAIHSDPNTDGCPSPPRPPGVPSAVAFPRYAASCPEGYDKKVQAGPDECEYSKSPFCPANRKILVKAGPDVCVY